MSSYFNPVKIIKTDNWQLELNSTIEETNKAYTAYKLNEAIKRAYDFTRADFCDWYIEFAKTRFYGDDLEDRKTAQAVAVHVMREILKLLHPYCPFITEELWGCFKFQDEELLISTLWPAVDSSQIDKNVESEIQILMDVITAIRNIRASLNVSPGKQASLTIRGDKKKCNMLRSNENYLQRLAKLDDIQSGEKAEKPAQSATAVVQGMELFVPLAGLIDLSKEIDRLERQIQDMKGRLSAVSRKLENKKFVERAPENVISHERDKMQKYESDLSKLQQNLEALQ